MGDKIDNEFLDNLSESQKEKNLEEKFAKKAKNINKQIQENTNMEVHHHAHESHGKKNLKSYFWEFLMLFLAVFCGFLAEYKLEHVIEHNREKEFIKSMIEDAQMDTANISRVIKINKLMLSNVNELAAACFNYENQKTTDFEIYKLYRKSITAIYAVNPSERTLLQLKNAGGMRLIRNKNAADLILGYDEIQKEVKSQQDRVDKLDYDFVISSYEFFNFKYLDQGRWIDISPEAKLLSHDNIKLTQFGNKIAAYSGTFNQYNNKLQEMKENAVNLINNLRKEYQLTDQMQSTANEE